jgi:hypothetical protein
VWNNNKINSRYHRLWENTQENKKVTLKTLTSNKRKGNRISSAIGVKLKKFSKAAATKKRE